MGYFNNSNISIKTDGGYTKSNVDVSSNKNNSSDNIVFEIENYVDIVNSKLPFAINEVDEIGRILNGISSGAESILWDSSYSELFTDLSDFHAELLSDCIYIKNKLIKLKDSMVLLDPTFEDALAYYELGGKIVVDNNYDTNENFDIFNNLNMTEITKEQVLEETKKMLEIYKKSYNDSVLCCKSIDEIIGPGGVYIYVPQKTGSITGEYHISSMYHPDEFRDMIYNFSVCKIRNVMIRMDEYTDEQKEELIAEYEAAYYLEMELFGKAAIYQCKKNGFDLIEALQYMYQAETNGNITFEQWFYKDSYNICCKLYDNLKADMYNLQESVYSCTQEIKAMEFEIKYPLDSSYDGTDWNPYKYINVNDMKNTFLYMNNQQKENYAKYYKQYGKEVANEYLVSIEDTLNQAKGEALAKKKIEAATNKDGSLDWVKIFGNGLEVGFESFCEGIVNIFNADGVKTDGNYEQMYYMQYLVNSSGIYLQEIYDKKILSMRREEHIKSFENAFSKNCTNADGSLNLDYIKTILTKEEYDIFLNKQRNDKNNFNTWVYEFGVTSGNMLPSMAVGVTLSIFSKTAGVAWLATAGNVLSNFMMGFSTLGNSINDALIKGHALNTAIWYGACSSLSEVGLGLMLGNIPGLNADAKFCLKGIFSEGLEEMIQEYVGAGLNAVILNESVDFEELNGQALKSFIFGALMSGVSTGIVSGIEATTLGVAAKINGQNINVDLNNISSLFKQLNNEKVVYRKNYKTGQFSFYIPNDADIDIDVIKQAFPDSPIIVTDSNGTSLFMTFKDKIVNYGKSALSTVLSLVNFNKSNNNFPKNVDVSTENFVKTIKTSFGDLNLFMSTSKSFDGSCIYTIVDENGNYVGKIQALYDESKKSVTVAYIVEGDSRDHGYEFKFLEPDEIQSLFGSVDTIYVNPLSMNSADTARMEIMGYVKDGNGYYVFGNELSADVNTEIYEDILFEEDIEYDNEMVNIEDNDNGTIATKTVFKTSMYSHLITGDKLPQWTTEDGLKMAEDALSLYESVYGIDSIDTSDFWCDVLVDDYGYNSNDAEGKTVINSIQTYYINILYQQIGNYVYDSIKNAYSEETKVAINSYILNADGTMTVKYKLNGKDTSKNLVEFEVNKIFSESYNKAGVDTMNILLHLEENLSDVGTSRTFKYEALNKYVSSEEVIKNMTEQDVEEYEKTWKNVESIDDTGIEYNFGFFTTEENISLHAEDKHIIGYANEDGTKTQWAMSLSSLKDNLKNMKYNGTKLTVEILNNMSDVEIQHVAEQLIAVPMGSYNDKKLVFVAGNREINFSNMTSNSLRGANDSYTVYGRTAGNLFEADVGAVDIESSEIIKLDMEAIRKMLIMLLQ